MTAPRPTCVHCGSVYGQRKTHDETVTVKRGEKFPAYRGNGILVKDFRVSENATTSHRTIWDGESYWKPYEPFCKLRCALAYARKAYAVATKQPKQRRPA